MKEGAAAIRLGQVVRSTAGRDLGSCYLVVKVIDHHFVAVADGRARTADRPKRKNIRHLFPIAEAPEAVLRRLATSQKADDEEIRRILAEVQWCEAAQGGSSPDGQGGRD